MSRALIPFRSAHLKTDHPVYYSTVVEHKRNAFAPAAKSAWNKVRVSEGDDGFGDDHGRGGEQDEREPEDEAPAVVSVTQDVAPADDGPRALQGGIQSAASLREENERRKAKLEKQRLAAEAERALARARARENGEDSDDGHDETVYRDSSGKRIDTKAQKAELARKRREDMEKQMQRMEWGKGEVQKENQEAKRRELESMRYKPAARYVPFPLASVPLSTDELPCHRYADDVEMNEEMKDQDRWNDPAASFLTTTKKKSKGPRRPQYTGPPPPPNRFGIAPGYRWDGVDRSNGFERQLMQSGNSRRVRDAEAYAWGAEDM